MQLHNHLDKVKVYINVIRHNNDSHPPLGKVFSFVTRAILMASIIWLTAIRIALKDPYSKANFWVINRKPPSYFSASSHGIKRNCLFL
jgi:hypothetical protein